MADHLFAAGFVLVAWWFSTGVILLMDGLPRSTFRFSLTGASVLALGGLYGLYWSSGLDSRPAAYLAFSFALLVWAWHELTFLLGIVTGPRKAPCPPDARGWRRFGYATAAMIHHEVALALTLLAVVALTWGAPNQVGTWTFLVLWIMRLSAKLNVFLGVRNLTTEFIPQHLRYLLSYFRRARLNPLMPVSLLVASAVGGPAQVRHQLQQIVDQTGAGEENRTSSYLAGYVYERSSGGPLILKLDAKAGFKTIPGVVFAANNTASDVDVPNKKVYFVGTLNQTDFRAFSEDVASAVSYKGMIPAAGSGITGFDIGVFGAATEVAHRDELRKAARDIAEAVDRAHRILG